QSGASIDGVIVSKDGGGIPGASVRIGSGYDAPRMTMADHEGRFHVTGLARRPVTLVARSESASSEPMALDLAATPEQRDVRVTLAFDQAISGQVVDASGKLATDVS